MKKALFICGSHNQTTMMHKISDHLRDDFQCYFTPFYADGLIDRLSQWGLLEFTILGKRTRREAETYLEEENLFIDYRGVGHEYDLVVSGTDTLVPRNIYNKDFVLVQEGMMEAETWVYPLVKNLGLPRYLANTAATGLSDAYAVFCVASPGYRDEFIRKGVNPRKIIVTGIPNFDDAKSFCDNDFPYRDYVLAATSPLRETFHSDNRKAFIRRVREIAQGRPLIFKLHPLEKSERARREISAIIPGATILTEGNTEQMVANCRVLVTQVSSVTFTGMALGKEVHTDLNLAQLEKLLPIQNGGKSADKIAAVCRQVLKAPQVEMNPSKGILPSSQAKIQH